MTLDTFKTTKVSETAKFNNNIADSCGIKIRR